MANPPDKPGKFLQFSPTIELGHILQVVVMIVALGGWALVGYQSITKQLDQHAAEMTLFKQRLTVDEAAIADLRDALRVSNSETRTQLTKITDMLGDLRTLVAAQGGRQDARPSR